MPTTIEDLNTATPHDFAAGLADVYGKSPWIAARAAGSRPFRNPDALRLGLTAAVRAAGREEQLALIRAHADAGGNAPVAHHASSVIQSLAARYREKFDFPCVLDAAGPRGVGRSAADVTETLQRRLENHADFEFAECLRNVHRIAELRLDKIFGTTPALGNLVWDWAEQLAIHSDPGYMERGELTVTYLTDAHRAVMRQLSDWMRECGFDDVNIDAVGNVVGIYYGADRDAKRLLTGSHFDTVRNGGKYDGRLGILVPMACVQTLRAQKRRLPFGIEVVGFSEEEGQRYKAGFLASGALTGRFEPRWLEQKDADGISMREAMKHAGLNSADIATLQRNPARYLGFVEVHIEQGPVLNELDLPLGIVTSINGSVRYLGEITGMASHAGTTPMDRRRDAATATAELALFAEKRAGATPNCVATMGMLEVPNGSINVIPGRCKFSLDIRATTNAVRDACADDVRDELAAICQRRGLNFKLEETMSVAAAPSAPAWQRRWERAVEALGLPVHRMPSGAGHDAMMLHQIMPQAMLFMRGLNAGISHNRLESITNHDTDLCVRAFQNLLDQLSTES